MHRPTQELKRITPGNRDAYLFRDVVYWKEFQREHDEFTEALRGEGIEALSRELGVESYRLQEWYDGALAGLDCGLRERGGDPLAEQLKKAHAMVGELTMMNELYQERIRRNESRPFVPKRSRR